MAATAGDSTARSSQGSGLGTAAGGATLLEIERDRLLRSNQHLERSVVELKQALQHDPDPEFRAAINDDLVLMAKQRARIAALEDEITRAKARNAADISATQLAAVPVTEYAQAGAGAAAAPTAAAQQQQQQQAQPHAAAAPAAGGQPSSTGPHGGQAHGSSAEGGGEAGMWL